jgi:diacylglycerol kinase family enzyme
MKPNEGYIAYIVNPKSGASSSKFTDRQFRRYLIEKDYDVRVSLTTSLEHACRLATDAAADSNCGMVVAAGGDGTVREIAHGLEGSSKVLLVVPCGTENLLANELGFDERMTTVVRAFESGSIRCLDLGSANGKCFTSIAGFGFDGEVVERFSKQRTGHIDHFDYLGPIWQTFWAYKFAPIRVEVEGEKMFDGRGLVFVGNISRYAIGLQILYSANYSDGLLDVCVYRCAGRLHLVKQSVETILKLHAGTRDVIYRQGREITVSSDSAYTRTEIDGDPGPSLPVHIKVIPHAIKCLVPPGAKPAGIRTRILRAIGLHLK